MTDSLCASIMHWFAGSQDAPSAEIVAHVAECDHCRGSLVATCATHVAMPADSAISCAVCDADLPAYLELERTRGAAEAVQRYPQLWWHLLICPDCAEQARLMAALLDADAVGLIDAPPRARPQASPGALPPLRLSRGFLGDLFGLRPALGAAWSSEPERSLVAEDDLKGYRLAIFVRQRSAQLCDLEIGVDPPFIGAVVIRFGSQVFRAPLVNGSLASLSSLPITLLADRVGPDMLISIESERDNDAAC